MSPKMKITLAITTVAVAGIAGAAVHMKEMYSQMVERFTEYDPKVVRKAYTNMLKNSFAGRYANVDFDNDAVMTELFRQEVMKLLNK